MLLKDKNPTEVVVLRSVSDRIPFAARSDSVRSPIRFRTGSDRIAYASGEYLWGIVGKNETLRNQNHNYTLKSRNFTQAKP